MELEGTTKELQQRLSLMFKDLVDILEQQNISYYAVGGTLLGAVRHQGFIPWDDDIDISIPRPEYEAFIKSAHKFLPTYYSLETLHTTYNFPFHYAKLYDTRTTLITNFTQPFKRGIFIDIFPLDGISNDKVKQIKNIKKMRFYLKVYRRIFTTKVRSPKLSHRICHCILSPIAKLIYSKNNLINKINRLCSQVPWKNSDYIVNYMGAWKHREIQPKAWYNERVRLKFENFEIWGPKEYDKILTCLYGDYMQLPPKEKRKSHHKIQYINLDLPYKAHEQSQT